MNHHDKYLCKMISGVKTLQCSGPSRLALSSLWVVVIVILASYSGTLISYLAVDVRNLPFTSLKEAIASPSYEMWMDTESVFAEIFRVSDNASWKTTVFVDPFIRCKDMMTPSNGNIFRVTGHLCGEFPAQRPVTWSFDVFFDLRLNKRLSKQSWGWWFETLPRHYDVTVMHDYYFINSIAFLRIIVS